MRKSKQQIHIAMDPQVIEYHKNVGTNISQEAENYFRALMGKDENDPITVTNDAIKKLTEDLAKAKVERAKFEAMQKSKQDQEIKEALKIDVELMKKRFRAAETNKQGWEASQFKENLRKFKEKYNLGHRDAIDYASGIKDVD